MYIQQSLLTKFHSSFRTGKRFSTTLRSVTFSQSSRQALEMKTPPAATKSHRG